ncbi:bacterial type II and III secretion system family protein [Burkholderia pseudomallei MSHR4462]|nr:bacterial type II and III secretion system family protein [Burkholderia pseudomallei MSHR4462]ONC66615.1 type II secretory pathway protein [Burkholderia pseudomallei]
MKWTIVPLLLVVSIANAGQAVPPIPTLPPLPAGAVGPSAAALVPPNAPPAAVALSALRPTSDARVDLRFVPVAQVVDLIYADMLKVPYVIAPEVLADQRLISFRFDARDGDVRNFMRGFLASLGFTVDTRDGMDYVSKRDAISSEPQDSYVYHPRYRDAEYLSRLVQPLFEGRFTTNRDIATSANARMRAASPPTSAAAILDQATDALVFIGSAGEISALKKLLPQVDTPVGQVAVRAWVYEVSKQEDNNSAFQLALRLLGGRVGASIGSGTIGDDSNAIRLRAGGFEAAIAALNSDSRFRVVTSPNLRVRSGQLARLNVGQSVPVVGSVSYPSASGAPVQSVQYQDAGVIFQVQPTVKASAIDLNVIEEISDFVRTTTGVNNSPTKNTRKLESSFSVEDGDAVLIGGLTQDKESHLDSGLSFLPSWMRGRASNSSRTEILLLLQVQKL